MACENNLYTVTATTYVPNAKLGYVTESGKATLQDVYISIVSQSFSGNVVIGDAVGDTLTVNATPTFAENATFTKNVTVNGNTRLGNATTDTIGFYTTTGVARGAALTTQLTTVTHTAPGTPDYAIDAPINTSAFGFTSADEFNTVLSVIANLQARVAELEARLGSATGVGLFA